MDAVLDCPSTGPMRGAIPSDCRALGVSRCVGSPPRPGLAQVLALKEFSFFTLTSTCFSSLPSFDGGQMLISASKIARACHYGFSR